MTQTLFDQAANALDAGFFDQAACREWVLRRIHPDGALCPNCSTAVPQGKAQISFWTGGRVCCPDCKKYFTAHTGTILAGTDLDYRTIFALAVLAGFGMPDKEIAERLDIHRDTAFDWRDRMTLPGQPSTAQG